MVKKSKNSLIKSLMNEKLAIQNELAYQMRHGRNWYDLTFDEQKKREQWEKREIEIKYELRKLRSKRS